MSRRRRRRVRIPRITRLGKFYILVTLGVGFAAVNTAHNLLFLCLGLLLGLILAGGIISEVNLLGLTLERTVPARITAGEPFVVEITALNRKIFGSTFSIEVEDLVEGVPQKRRCFFLKLSCKDPRSVGYKAEIYRRGRYRFIGFALKSSFPFGLITKTAILESEEEVIVYPRPILVMVPWTSSTGPNGYRPKDIIGRGDEFFDLKEFRPGDDPRFIHWRSTARMGKPIVRVTEAEESETLIVLLDLRINLRSLQDIEKGEKAVGETAFVVHEALKRGFRVLVLAPKQMWVEAHSLAELDRVLRFLALLPYSNPEDPAPEKPERILGRVITIAPGVGAREWGSVDPVLEDVRFRERVRV